MNLNKCFVLGNLTRDPELKVLPSGSSVCNFSIATNRTWTDKTSGKKQEAVEFHNITAYGKMAEIVAQYMRKGSQMLVEGRIQTRSWETTTGEKKYWTEIIAESVQFGAKPRTSAPAAPQDEYDQTQPPPAKGDEIQVDSIPF